MGLARIGQRNSRGGAEQGSGFATQPPKFGGAALAETALARGVGGALVLDAHGGPARANAQGQIDTRGVKVAPFERQRRMQERGVTHGRIAVSSEAVSTGSRPRADRGAGA